MASGFAGGGPDFYNTTGFGARSTTMNMNNNNNNHNPSQQQQQQQSPYRSQMFHDPSQISNRTTPNFKRTLSEFQSQYHHHHHQQQLQQHQHHHQNPALANLFLRSVKPRMYQNISSPISPLPPIDFSPPEIPSLLSQQQQQQRFGMPLLQQLRPQPTIQQITNPTLSGVPYTNSVQQQQQNRVQPQDSEKKMMNQLLALEKQLLDDNDDEEGDAVSVVTNTNSEWSETIQNLISVPSPKPISTSPTSSTTSSSSSASTVASSPGSGCSKQMLMEAATAISEGKTDVANEILTRMGQVPNPMGNSEQKLMEYLLRALKSRGNSFENPPLLAELYSKEHVASTQLLYDFSPCFKLGFMAANHAILEATLDQQPNSGNNNNNNNNNRKLHVVDFDIGQGGQYMNLLHALSARQNGKQPPTAVVVKITAVADNNEGEERLRFVGDKLREFAEKVGVSLKFNVVVAVSHKLGDLSRDSLGCEPDDLLAVNFAFKLYRMPDESVSTENPRDELLRRVKGLSPRVVTLVEQEMNTNTAPFMARVGEVCSYYGALFDSIESTVPRDNNPDRVKVEEGLGRKLANSVACEGRERVERCEVFGKWRARMGMAGFELKPLSQNVAELMRARLTSGNRVNPGFTVKEENGGVCFGWMGRTLTVASAWR